MGCFPLRIFCLFFMFFLIPRSTHFRFLAEGRTIVKAALFSKKISEEKVILSARIGSRPPRCERRCSWCSHCEAIQVPTNPQVKSTNSSISNIAYARRDDDSNYKPMSWKCKCGNFIFNP